MADLTTEPEPPSGTRPWLVCCDESGMHGPRYYGFGSLWMSWHRRGDFSYWMEQLARKHRYTSECKWNLVSAKYLPFFTEVVDGFFRSPSLSFHCIVVDRHRVDMGLHRDRDHAHQKHFTLLLTDKIKRICRTHAGQQTFRIWVDPLPSRYQKAHEVVEIISNHVLRRSIGTVRPVDKVFVKDSKTTPGIQVVDLLLGAVMDGWNRESSSSAKAAIRTRVAGYLGWPDIVSDTWRTERKFNIWRFPVDRAIPTREVKLKVPLPGSAAPR